MIEGSGRRKLSEKFGLVKYLCLECHEKAHRDIEMRNRLHQEAERKWLNDTGGSIEDFIKVFGKNYL